MAGLKTEGQRVFYVKGPFNVPLDASKKSKWVNKPGPSFWDSVGDDRLKPGVFIFAVRAGKGWSTIYVGRTFKSFEKEAFTDHKLNKYNAGLNTIVIGTPCLFLVVHPPGKTNENLIKEVETWLIHTAYAKNPKKLKNKKKLPKYKWNIEGVLRTPQTKPTKGASQLRACIF